MFDKGESIEFNGKVIVKMAQDKNIMKYTSSVVIGAEYAQAHGIRDIDDREILSFRQLNYILGYYVLPDNLKFIANWLPNFLKIPLFLIENIN